MDNNSVNELEALEHEIIATNTYKSNYTGIILTKAVADDSESIYFYILYTVYDTSYYICRNTETGTVEVKTIAITEKVNELANLDDDNTTIQLIEQFIYNNITTNGHFTGAEEEAERIKNDLINSIKSLATDNEERIAVINRNNTEKITEIIANIESETESKEKVESVEFIKHVFNNIGNKKDEFTLREARQKLADFLSYYYGTMLRANSHEVYVIDDTGKAYKEVERDYLITDLARVLKQPNLIHTVDLNNGLDFISNRLHPTHNIVKFNNCIYSMEEHRVIKELDKPLFTLIEVPYNYNPKAKCKYMKDYLETAFKRETEEETKKQVKGVLQLVGYLLTSGNVRTALIIITGVSGAGKSLFAKLLMAMVNNKVSDIQLKDMDKDHMTSGLVGCHLNIANDTSDKPIYDNSIIKKVTGNDPVGVNPKGETPYTLHPNEVPKNIVPCNNPPIFINLEPALLERLIFIHFKYKIRGTDKDDPNFSKKLLNPEEMEWLIYHSLEAYKEMEATGDNFILRLDNEATRKMAEKHSKPINYCLSEVILKHDEEAFKTELEKAETQKEKDNCFIIAKDLNNILVYLAEKEGLELKLDKRGLISSKTLTGVIKEEYEIDTDTINYTTKTERLKYYNVSKRVYPNLIKTERYDELLAEYTEEKLKKEEAEKGKK